jgi:hypothetical protein
VTENQRFAHHEIAGSAVTEIVQVGAANAAGAQPDADHALSEAAERALDDAQIFGAEERGGMGGVGHRICASNDTEGSRE